MKKKNNGVKKLLFYILLIVVVVIGSAAITLYYQQEEPVKEPVKVVEQKTVEPVEIPKEELSELDLDGAKLTSTLRRNGFNMGLISSKLYKTIGFEFPEKAEESERQKFESAYKDNVPLDQIIPAPVSSENKNLLVWDKYNVQAPIIYASYEDIFQQNEEGALIYNEFVDNNPIDSPVQVKLRDGIVHLPFSPSPGEMGNSYIIGHSSNYSSVKSDYNFIFEPLIEKVSVGEEFKIYDYLGRDLTFAVIDTKVVKEADVAEAYVKYDDKRVVTLQGSILETVNGQILPTKRYLVIAELVNPPSSEPAAPKAVETN